MPQATAGDMFTDERFVGNHVGSQAVIIEFSLLLLFKLFSRGKEEQNKGNGSSSKQGTSVSNSIWVIVDLLRICTVKVMKVETEKKNMGSRHITGKDAIWSISYFVSRS